mgnify:CR=1 FL=1
MFQVNASRIRQLLIQRRLSLRQFALQAGLNQITAAKCIKDGATVAITTIAAIAEFFGTSGDELILRKDDDSDISTRLSA